MAITRRISLTVDARAVRATLDRLRNEFGSLSARVSGTNRTLFDFSGALSNSERIVRQSLGSMSRADQALLRYDTTLRRLNQALANGRIDQSSFDQAVAAAGNQYRRTASQAQRLERSTRDLGISARAAELSFESLTGALTAFGGLIAGNEIIQALDVFTDLQSRLKTTAQEGENLAETQQKIIDLALESRTSLDDNSLLYLRLSNSVDRAKVSQQQLLDIQETVNKSISLGGSNAAEASGALRQFTQIVAGGFTSGFAQEINSLSEQTPGLFNLLIDGLRATSQEFRDLEASGTIGIKAIKTFSEKGIGDLDMLLKAIASQTSNVRDQFELVNITFSRAIGNVGTAITDYLGKLDQSIGFTKTFATAINDLALNFEDYKKEIDILAAGLAGFSVVLAGGALVAIGSFIGTVGLIGIAVGGAASAFTAFKDEIIEFGDKHASVIDLTVASFELIYDKLVLIKDIGIETFNALPMLFDQAIDTFEKEAPFLFNTFKSLTKGIKSLFQNGFDLKDILNNSIASFLSFYDVLAGLLSNLKISFSDLDESARSVGDAAPVMLMNFSGFFAGVKDFVNLSIGYFVNFKNLAVAASKDAANALLNVFDDENRPTSALAAIKAEIAFANVDYLGNAGNAVSSYFTDVIDYIPKATKDVLNKLGIDVDEIIKKRFGKDYIGGIASSASEVIDVVFDKAIRKTKSLKKETGEASDNDYYFLTRMQKEVENTITWFDMLMDKWDQVVSGFRAGASSYADSVKTLGEYTKGLTETLFQSMEDGLTEFAVTGKDIWKGLADDILREIVRIQIKALVVAPIAGLFGGSSVSAPTSYGVTTSDQSGTGSYGGFDAALSSYGFSRGGAFMGGEQRFAQGGLPSLSDFSGSILSTPTRFAMGGTGLMGESGSEAILPLQRTSSGDLGVAATGSAGDMNVNVTLINESGTPVQAVETGRRRNGNQVDLQLTLRQQVSNAIASGAADSAVKSRFGWTPVGA